MPARLFGIPLFLCNYREYDTFDVGFLTTDDFMNADILEATYPAVAKRLHSDWISSFAIPVITGFLGKGWKPCAVTTLGRGGSDLTATTIGKVLGLRQIQVWKDVDGVLTCDLSIHSQAEPVPYLTFEEAAGLAYFGAQVFLYGGQVISWKNNFGEELLFVSTKAVGKPPKAIRGGIPIYFPQFGSHGPLEQHGFARNRFWNIDHDPPPFPTSSTNKSFVDLILKPSEEDVKTWPHRYEFCLRVTLGPGGDLMLTSRIRNTNTDGKAFTFSFAYHNYLSVSDISEVRVEGLETVDYLDSLQDRQRSTEQGDVITFESEVDKIYVSTPTKIAILDHEKKRTFVLRKDGLPDAVVWNPWDKKAKAIPDLGDEDYKHMLCIESAAIEKPITLKPGEEWKGRQELSAVLSSYFSGQLDPQRVL